MVQYPFHLCFLINHQSCINVMYFSPLLCTLQAVIGIAFSLGFMFGPMIGALFSVLGRRHGEEGSFAMFQYPALFSLTLALLDIAFIAAFFIESLPPQRRVSIVRFVNVCVCVRSRPAFIYISLTRN